MAKYPVYLSDLAEDDRNHIKHRIKMLRGALRSWEGRLQSYEAGEDPYGSGSVFKLINDLKPASVMLDEMINQVVTKHGLPDDLKLIDAAYRQAFSNLLRGIPLE